MKKIWQQKIKELDSMIQKTSVSDTKKISELYRKRELLEDAFNRCEG